MDVQESFGRAPQREFEAYMNRHCRVWTFNKRQLQSVVNIFCGYYCCFFYLFRCRNVDTLNILLEILLWMIRLLIGLFVSINEQIYFYVFCCWCYYRCIYLSVVARLYFYKFIWSKNYRPHVLTTIRNTRRHYYRLTNKTKANQYHTPSILL